MKEEEYLVAIRCCVCGSLLHDGDVLWATEAGVLNTDIGNPYCDRCLPTEKE
jgi:hypothetical protein